MSHQNSVNLLPQPRSVALSEQRVANRLLQAGVDSTIPRQGYELHIAPDGARLAAGDEAGLFYGQTTLAQLGKLHDGMLPVGTIRDHPDIPVRCVMLDISRDKIPTMDTLYEIVQRLASWKINQLQLYMEHTFAYTNHPLVHSGSSPLTAPEIQALDDYCARHFVELAPNQNCLGHMERWLRHSRYAGLALAPDGFFDPYHLRRAPMTLDPRKPGSFALIRELLSELLPLFTSRRVHIGLDEVWELPPDRGAEYLEWIERLRSLPELDGREMLIWGDLVTADAELAGKLPAGVTVCEWGYESSHPFAERTTLLADKHVPFWIAAGTSSWLTILGRAMNMRENCLRAAEAAIANGASGFMITDWGDQGHLQQLPISDPGLAYAAAVSWCLEANRNLDLAAALSMHCFEDRTGELATALIALGDAHRAITPQPSNASALVLHLYFPQLILGTGRTEGIAARELDLVENILADACAQIGRAQLERADRAAVTDELHWSVELVALLVADAKLRLAGDGSLASVSERARAALATELSDLITRYRKLWLFRNRPGGLEDSLSWLDNLRRSYQSGRPDPGWGGYWSPR
jgi:hexosaminidase